MMECTWLMLMISYVAYFARGLDGARILGLFPSNDSSDFAMYREVLVALADRGHQVDVVSYFPMAKPYANYTDIIDLNKLIAPRAAKKTIDELKYETDGSIKIIAEIAGNSVCKLLGEPAFQRLIKEPPKNPDYNLVLTEFSWANCFLAFGRHLKVSVVGVSAKQILLPHASEALGNPLSTAYIPVIADGSIKNMTFWQRLKNTLSTSYLNFAVTYYTKIQTNLVQKYFGPEIPDIRQLEKDVALLLINTHHSLTGVRPTIPTIVEVGGLHVRDDSVELPADVQKWLDASQDGCIYINLGPDVKLEMFPKETLGYLYTAIARIRPIRVLLKVNVKEIPPGLTGNVMTFSKLPQQNILRHPNIKAFVTVGSLMDIQEAITYAIPLIGIPMFDDQSINIKNCVDKGIAVSLDFDEITAESFVAAVDGVVKEQKFKNAAVIASKLFLDRPMKARDTAVYWIQYVLRHGKDSLRSSATKLSSWQLALLDVYGTLLLAGLFVIFIIKLVVTTIIRRLMYRPIMLPLSKKGV